MACLATQKGGRNSSLEPRAFLSRHLPSRDDHRTRSNRSADQKLSAGKVRAMPFESVNVQKNINPRASCQHKPPAHRIRKKRIEFEGSCFHCNTPTMEVAMTSNLRSKLAGKKSVSHISPAFYTTCEKRSNLVVFFTGIECTGPSSPHDGQFCRRRW